LTFATVYSSGRVSSNVSVTAEPPIHSAVWEPAPDRDKRALRRVAWRYAIAAILLLGVCCYGVYWLGTELLAPLADLP